MIRSVLCCLVAALGAMLCTAACCDSIPRITGSIAATEPAERVPFVGCRSIGQNDMAPPKDDGKSPMLPRHAARELARYASGELSVLAPRGWHCIGINVAAGSGLTVTPTPFDPFAEDAMKNPVHGPFVEIGYAMGGTEGRLEVAQAAARLFPDERDYVQRIIAEGFWPAKDFPSGPYPNDVVTRQSATTIDYVTPAHRRGRGTSGRFRPGDDPIHGSVALLKDDASFDLFELEVRLPAGLSALAPLIVDAARPAPAKASASR